MAPASENLIGKTIFGEYTITKKLGEGGMGSVYLASQQAIDQHIAIKVLHGHASKNDEMVKRFNREAKTISMLTHPNIIRVFIFGRTEDGLIYLAMEFVKGPSLRDDLSRRGAMDELRTIKILKQILSSLSEAHEIGIIHRDLKPDNIILTTYRGQTDFVKVLDFGIAKVKEPDGTPEQKLTQVGVVYGTPEYLSPEQAQAIELDHRTDLYSLGIILYEMMTGKLPFKASTAVQILMMHVHQAPVPPSQHTPMAPEMEQIILKAIDKNPDRRYQNAQAFLDALFKREQQLIASGKRIDLMRMPGQDATMAYVMPDDVTAQAQAAIAAAKIKSAPTPSAAPAKAASSGVPKIYLVAIIGLLILLLLLIGAFIVKML